MTREEAIHELGEWLEQMIQHGVPSHSAKRKALATAIALLSAEAEPTIIGIDIPYGSDKGLATLFKCKDDKLILEEVKEIMSVVRCKDCRWYDNRYGDVCHNPRYGDGWANYPSPYVDEDYWCKDGERKGGEDE